MKPIYKSAAALAALLMLLGACGDSGAAERTNEPSLSITETVQIQQSPTPSEAPAEPEQTDCLKGEQNTIRYELQDFTLSLPVDWKGHYTVSLGENDAILYSTENMKAGYEGYLFDVICTEEDLSEYNYLFLDSANGKYIWMGRPEGEEYGEQQALKEEYDFLAKDVEKIAENISVKTQGPEHYLNVIQKESTDKMCLYYPQFIDLGQAEERVNKLIKEAAYQCIRDMQSITEAWVTLYYRVKCDTCGLISVVFNGYGYGDAGPTREFLYTVNVDVENKTLIRLNDILNVDDTLIDLLLGGKYSSTGEWMGEEYYRNILLEKSRSDWLQELLGADQWNCTCASTYFTGDALVFSLPENNAASHVETAVGYDDLAAYKTESAVWKRIKSLPASINEGNPVDPAELHCPSKDANYLGLGPVNLDFNGDGNEETMNAYARPSDWPIEVQLTICDSEITIYDSCEDISLYAIDLDSRDAYLDLCLIFRTKTGTAQMYLIRYDGTNLYLLGFSYFFQADRFYYDGKGNLFFDREEGFYRVRLPEEG